jgi:hypothetical protein
MKTWDRAPEKESLGMEFGSEGGLCPLLHALQVTLKVLSKSKSPMSLVTKDVIKV